METYEEYRKKYKKIMISIGYKMIKKAPNFSFTVSDWVQEADMNLFSQCYNKGISSSPLVRTVLTRALIDVLRKHRGRGKKKKHSTLTDQRWLGVDETHGVEEKGYEQIEKQNRLLSICPTSRIRKMMRMRLEGKTIKEIGYIFGITESAISLIFKRKVAMSVPQ